MPLVEGAVAVVDGFAKRKHNSAAEWQQVRVVVGIVIFITISNEIDGANFVRACGVFESDIKNVRASP